MQTVPEFVRKKRVLIAVTLIYKVVLEISFWKVLTIDYPYYQYWFDTGKYINGMIWVIIILELVNYKKRAASTFFLFFLIVLQIIPISSIYAMTADNSILFFNMLCSCFAICELMVSRVGTKVITIYNRTVSDCLVPCFLAIAGILLLLIILRNGRPSLKALNLYSVYDLRRNSTLIMSKIESYLLSPVVTVFLPVVLIKAVNYRKKTLILVASFALLAFYLYTGHKTYLFSIALCLVGALFANKEDTFFRFFKYYLFVMIILSALTTVWRAVLPSVNNYPFKVYTFLVRRALFVPAELKFVHYDYFTHHPHLQLAGMLPIAINPLLPHYYIDTRYTLEIGKIYYNAPAMSADTGFFAEGYARFGFMGIFFSFLLLWIILKKIDAFQERNGYVTAISFFIYPIYALSEQQVFGTLFLGTWLFLLIILNHYDDGNGKVLGDLRTQKHRKKAIIVSE